MTYFWHSCTGSRCDGRTQRFGAQQWRLGTVLAGILSFAAVEWRTGSWCHSLALQSDAWHMVGDAGAILLALSASRCVQFAVVRRLPRRLQLETMAAFMNAIALMIMAGLILWEGIQHWHHLPHTIVSGPMLVTAIIGLGVNIVGVVLLHEGSQADLNMRGAFLHMVADLANSVGVIISAVAIANFRWFWLDSVVSVLIALFIGQSALPLLQRVWQQWTQPPPPVHSVWPEIGRTSLTDLISEQR